MGKRIDRAARFLLTTTAAYLFFLNAWHSVPLACAAAFAAMALGRAVWRGRPKKRPRCALAQADGEVARIAALPDDEAERALAAIVRGRYPGEAFGIAPFIRHPASSLSPGDILAAWKAHRGEARLVVAATCGCDPAAALYARELAGPAVAVLDGHAIARILRAGGWQPADEPARRLSPRDIARRLGRRVAAHRTTPREALAAALGLALFAFNRRPLFLVLPSIVLARFGMTIGARGGTGALFGDR